MTEIKVKKGNTASTILSFNKKEQKEFEKDIEEVVNKLKKEVYKHKTYEGKIVANQRFSTGRYFKSIYFFDLTSNEKPIIYIEDFLELKLDDYLDDINYQKSLNDDGFIKL